MKTVIKQTLIIIILLSFTFSVQAQLKVDIETGIVWNGYNDVRVPQEQGTEFSLVKDKDDDVSDFYRIQLFYYLNNKHVFRFLYAPLKTFSKGIFNKDVYFAGELFPENTYYAAVYKFNSYRVTYRYNFSSSGKFQWGLGLTAKIRDAKIEVIGNNQQAEKIDLGFVPLIYFNLKWFPADQLSLELTGEALASPNGQGRAEDVLLSLNYLLKDNIKFKAGYRILEGGADVEEVYNFTLFHYAVVGATVEF